VAANEKYNELKSRIRSQIERDVARELEWISKQFNRFIIGRQRRRFQGSITTKLRTGETDINGNPTPTSRSGLGLLSGRWKERSPRYLSWKRRKFGHEKWFENTGTLGNEMKSSWTTWFGPIQVKVFREKEKHDIGDGHTRFAVGKIEVRTFGNITPAMLPALATGNPEDIGSADGRRSGLISMIHAKSPDTAYRLAGGEGSGVPYRPTLEPFLAFAITRSVPTAVFNRVQNLAGVRRSGGSAGRVGRSRPS
jgi:hypothetical protein